MRSLNFLNSIDNNQNIDWDNGYYSLITGTLSHGTASNGSLQSKMFDLPNMRNTEYKQTCRNWNWRENTVLSGKLKGNASDFLVVKWWIFVRFKLCSPDTLAQVTGKIQE